MANESRLSQSYKWALVVDEQELRRLVDECQRSVAEAAQSESGAAKLELEVQFSHGLSFSTEVLDEVLAEENPRGRAISALHIRVFNNTMPGSSSTEIVCDLSSDPKDRTSHLSVKGTDRQWVYVTLSRLEDRLRRMKQWHPPARTSFVPISLLAALGYLYSLLAIAKRYPSLMEQVGTDGKPQPTIAGLALLLGIIPVILITTYLIMLLLPDPVFRIGDGTVRHDRVKSVRSKLGWMILAIIAAAILTRMARLFGTPW
jgi:hypothetical protein